MNASFPSPITVTVQPSNGSSATVKSTLPVTLLFTSSPLNFVFPSNSAISKAMPGATKLLNIPLSEDDVELSSKFKFLVNP